MFKIHLFCWKIKLGLKKYYVNNQNYFVAKADVMIQIQIVNI